MRRLVSHFDYLRAPKYSDGERGSVAVITALSLVVLLGFAALAIDVGMIYEKRAQLQNGADAASLAIAQECATGSACTREAARATAVAMVDANARHGKTAARILDLKTDGEKEVRVEALTGDEKGDAGSLTLALASVLGMDSVEIAARATASWGSGPGDGPADLPIAIHMCEIDPMGAPQALTLGGKDGSRCPPGGTNPPGGFGWIGESTTSCRVPVKIGQWIESDTGISLPKECKKDPEFDELVGKTILVPVYQKSLGAGSSKKDPGRYLIEGWAAFALDGYYFPGEKGYDDSSCSENCKKGLYGRFVEIVTVDDRFAADGSSKFGVSLITLED